MATQQVSPELFAQVFHHYHQILSSGSNGSNSDVAEGWEDLSSSERNSRIAAARLALLEFDLAGDPSSRRYFAKPGEAEWGC